MTDFPGLDDDAMNSIRKQLYHFVVGKHGNEEGNVHFDTKKMTVSEINLACAEISNRSSFLMTACLEQHLTWLNEVSEKKIVKESCEKKINRNRKLIRKLLDQLN